MTTSRVAGRPCGHASRCSGLCTRCCTPCTTTGRPTPWTWSRPLSRRMLAPCRCRSSESHRPNAAQSSGASAAKAERGRAVGVVPAVVRVLRRRQPSPDLGRSRRRVVQVVEQERGGRRIVLGRAVQRRRGVERREPPRQPLDRRRRRQIDLAQDQPVRQRRLLGRLVEPLEVAGAVHRVDHGDHVAEPEMVAQRRVGREAGDDRDRVGEPRGLDHDPAEGRDLAAASGRAGGPSPSRRSPGWCSRRSRS